MLLRVLSTGIDMIHKNEVVTHKVVNNSKGCCMTSFEDRAHKASTSNWITSWIMRYASLLDNEICSWHSQRRSDSDATQKPTVSVGSATHTIVVRRHRQQLVL
jgi:hypothetical protein